jgi:hypothetical protein
MKTVRNTTQKPLSVPLPRGKVLHLGPGKTGQIASGAAEHPGFKKLVDGGELEIIGEGTGHTEGSASGIPGRPSMRGFGSAGRGHRSGDR